ncbi:MAG: hypothetical protein ASARMPRED_005161 [Alectoria sarmentosa]|nr:MAG: hypothetical protein ASARMPRED_005161 [Alectoria sarmentosa]
MAGERMGRTVPAFSVTIVSSNGTDLSSSIPIFHAHTSLSTFQKRSSSSVPVSGCFVSGKYTSESWCRHEDSPRDFETYCTEPPQEGRTNPPQATFISQGKCASGEICVGSDAGNNDGHTPSDGNRQNLASSGVVTASFNAALHNKNGSRSAVEAVVTSVKKLTSLYAASVVMQAQACSSVSLAPFPVPAQRVKVDVVMPNYTPTGLLCTTVPSPTFYFNPSTLAILGMSQMTEDDIYRTSTQYRLWSFTRESLASLRSTTNASAADGVRAAIRSQRTGQAGSGTAREGSNQKPSDPSKEVDCLTVEEEQKLVGFYCVKAMQFADFCEFPTNVKATAVQYLKRFYLSNSPMTYHPKEMMAAALFLSTKTENHYTSLRSFASKLPKTTPESVVAPEFLLTQGLRFTFDVRHPHRGLEGGVMELLALAHGKGQAGPESTRSSEQVQKEMVDIQPAKESSKKSRSADDVARRIQAAHGKAKEVGKSSALLTDAYFLYTPSQIWLSSLFLADEPLTRFYIDTKIPKPSTLKMKLITTLQACAKNLGSSASAKPGEAEIKALTKIDKKLFKCRNPEKVDLVGINKAQKRDSEDTGDNGLDEKVIKKRKMEREKSEKEAEDIFGPSLAKEPK